MRKRMETSLQRVTTYGRVLGSGRCPAGFSTRADVARLDEWHMSIMRGAQGRGHRSLCCAAKKNRPQMQARPALGAGSSAVLFFFFGLVLVQGEEIVELAIGELAQPALTGGDREIG